MPFAPGPYHVGRINDDVCELVYTESGYTGIGPLLDQPARTVTMRPVATVPNCGDYTTGNIALFRLAPDLVDVLARLVRLMDADTRHSAPLRITRLPPRREEVEHARALLSMLGVPL